MDNRKGDVCCRGLELSCRIFGLVTALVLWGVGIEYVFFGTIFGIYFLAIAVITTFLEVVFLLNYVVEECVGRTSWFQRVWDFVLCVDDWKKGGIYFILFAPPCFVKPAEAVLGVPAGCLLILIGVLYMLKTFKTKREEETSSIEDNVSYDRFEDEMAEDLEDDIVNPTRSPANGITSVADQSEILDL